MLNQYSGEVPNIEWSLLFPFKADSELVVDQDAVLAGTFTLESLQAIAVKGGDVFQPHGPNGSERASIQVIQSV